MSDLSKDAWGGIEAGGTKFICAIGIDPQNVVSEIQIRTSTPAETLAQVVSFFRESSQERALRGVGVGCFGPLDLNPLSNTYGFITSTPKAAWQNTDVLGTLESALNIPIAFDTDVNAAALGEHVWGAGLGVENLIYLTVGTGIGGGAMVDGHLLHGMVHPEMGHLLIPHDREQDPFPGICPFHGDCLEGLASGPALNKRWGQPAEALPADHPGWQLEAKYLAYGLANLIVSLSPQRVIIGGGILNHPSLIGLIRTQVLRSLNGYVQSAELQGEMDRYIVKPMLGNRAGVLGAIALAKSNV